LQPDGNAHGRSDRDANKIALDEVRLVLVSAKHPPACGAGCLSSAVCQANFGSSETIRRTHNPVLVGSTLLSSCSTDDNVFALSTARRRHHHPLHLTCLPMTRLQGLAMEILLFHRRHSAAAVWLWPRFAVPRCHPQLRPLACRPTNRLRGLAGLCSCVFTFLFQQRNCSVATVLCSPTALPSTAPTLSPTDEPTPRFFLTDCCIR
jgi:hypothetical protein